MNFAVAIAVVAFLLIGICAAFWASRRAGKPGPAEPPAAPGK